MAAVNRFEDRAHVAAVVTGRDGVIGAVSDGVTAEQMPTDDDALYLAWAELEEAYSVADSAAKHVRFLLERAA